jgi:F-type H+-transporting ATPase subunit delta
MNTSKISVRYAKSIFELANEKNQLDRVYSDLQLVFAISKENVDFKAFFDSPIIKTSERAEFMKNVFGKHICELSLSLLLLIVAHRRESHIESICRRFEELYKQKKGIKTALLTTSISVNPAIEKEIQSIVNKLLNTEVQLTSKVNTALIGGFILKVEDKQFDASIANGLKTVKRQLLNANIDTK